MKLETKHIIPYLPYNIHALIDGVVCEIEGIDLHCKDTVIAERVNYKLENVKLVLRPLSDLTKEVEVNQEKFVPFDRLSYSCRRQHDLFGLQNTLDLKAIDYLKLLEWHFDIFGGIGTWAIDINKLKDYENTNISSV